MLSTEKACSQLLAPEAESLRGEIVNILRKAKPPTPNISIEESRVLDNLRKETSIHILPADKGRATVIMDKEEFKTKVTVPHKGQEITATRGVGTGRRV